MTRITVWIDWISTLCVKMGKVIVLVGGMGILLSMAIGVFSRALLSQVFMRPEEVSCYLLIWCIFVGGSVALHSKNLVRFEFIINLFKGKAYTVAEIVGHLLFLVFLVLFTWIDIDLIPYYLNSVETTVPIQLIRPAAGALLGGMFMVIHMIDQVCRDILRLTGWEGGEAKQ